MRSSHVPTWLKRGCETQADNLTGSHFADDSYHLQQYQRLNEISAEIISVFATFEEESLTEIVYNQIGYAIHRLGNRGAVSRSGELLFIQERFDQGWTLPGAWANVGESPIKNVEKEVWEESGFHVGAACLFCIYDTNRIDPLQVFHADNIPFLCDLPSGNPHPSRETSSVEFSS